MELEQAKIEYAAARAAYLEAQQTLKSAWQLCANKGMSYSPVEAVRFRLPDDRQSLTHKVHFIVDGEPLDMYVQPSFFPDGRLGEVFLKADKQGSFESGLVDGISLLFSLALQYGAPAEHLIEKLKGTNSSAISVVGADPKVRMPRSMLDYLARYLERAIKIQNGEIEMGKQEVKIDQSEG
jgi:ribonucleoside-diphosphate reductase alpha chain